MTLAELRDELSKADHEKGLECMVDIGTDYATVAPVTKVYRKGNTVYLWVDVTKSVDMVYVGRRDD